MLKRFWVPVGSSDYSSVIEAMPDEAQAIVVGLTGTDAVHFIDQYLESGGRLPMLGISTPFDLSALSFVSDSVAKHLVGAISSGPIAPENPDPRWQRFVESYHKHIDDALDFPSLFAFGFYINAKASLLALEQISGELSMGHYDFQQALNALEFDGPCGPIRLDENRQAISANFIQRIGQTPDGKLYEELISTEMDVESTLGIPKDEYLTIGSYTRDNPPL